MRHALNAPRTLEINKRHHPPVFNRPLKSLLREPFYKKFLSNSLQKFTVFAWETLPCLIGEGLPGNYKSLKGAWGKPFYGKFPSENCFQRPVKMTTFLPCGVMTPLSYSSHITIFRVLSATAMTGAGMNMHSERAARGKAAVSSEPTGRVASLHVEDSPRKVAGRFNGRHGRFRTADLYRVKVALYP